MSTFGSTLDASAVLDTVSDAIVVLDRAGRFQYLNAAAALAIGASRESLLGRSARDVVPHLADGALAGAVRETIRAGGERRLRHRRHSDGAAFEVRVTPHSNGAALSFRTLPSSTADTAFVELAERSVTGLVVIQDERLVYANPRYAALFGYTLPELAAIPTVLDLVHPDDRAVAAARMRAHAAGAVANDQYSIRGLCRDGSVVELDVYDMPATFDGRPAVAATVVDVTERRAAEAAVRASNETLRAVIDTAPQAIVGVDLQRRVTRWNPAAERLFGWTAAEILGAELPIVPEHEYAGFWPRLDALTERGETMETRRRHKDGRLVDVSISRAPIRDAVGAVVGYVAVIADISGRKALEEQLRQAQKMEAVGRLAGGVAHDFNNLLTVILSNAELAAAGMPGDASEELGEIRRAAERAGALTAQLLTLSRRQVVKTETLELNAVVREAERMLRRVVPESMVLVTDLAPSAGYVRADRGQLEQVLMNLVVNARDAMPSDGGTVFVRTARRRADGGRTSEAVLAVQDTGSGMDGETLSRVFEPFFTTKAAGKGTGLGLATVYGIVKQSGGVVRVDSAPGAGTTVTVRLPSAGTPPAAEPAPAAPPPSPAAGRTAMLVEDEASVRGVARRILERAGFRVLEATNGAEGLQLWAGHAAEVDVVVTDVVMPGMGGPALAERLLAERPELPVVFMSGYTAGAPEARTTSGRPVVFLAKPFSPDGLLRAVAEAVDGGRAKDTR